MRRCALSLVVIMASEYQSVSLARIDCKNKEYAITTGHYSHDLKHSIKCVGLINPPTLLIRDTRFVIVSGFKRIEACISMGWDEIVARCLPAETSSVTCALIAIADNAAMRLLNPVELAQAVTLLSALCQKKSDVLVWFHHLGLGVNEKLLKKLAHIARMSNMLKAALVNQTVALPVAIRIQNLVDSDDRNSLCQLLHELNVSLNRQRDLVDWIVAISKREQKAISALLEEAPVQQLRRNESMDPGHRTRKIIDYFKIRRFPQISAHQENYLRTVQNLKLNKGIRINPPPHFESRKYTISFEFESQNELCNLTKEIQRIASSTEVAELINH